MAKSFQQAWQPPGPPPPGAIRRAGMSIVRIPFEKVAEAVTPDGRSIVFYRRDGEIYRVDLERGAVHQLTHGRGYVHFPPRQTRFQ